MLVVVGSRVRYRAVGHGVFHCERCGGDRPYRHRSGWRWAHLLGIPLVRLGPTGEHLICSVCRTCYRVDLLAVPTSEQMQAALLAGTTAAMLAILRAGSADSPVARSLAAATIRNAGAPGYDDARLAAALRGAGQAIVLRPAVEAFAVQLEEHASEWFLAKVVQVGLADGLLTTAQRQVAQEIAGYLGMTRAKGRSVISLTEKAAQAG